MTTHDDLIARAEAALEGITPPWRAVTTGVAGGDHWHVCESDESIALIAASDGCDEHLRQPRAEFIAAAPGRHEQRCPDCFITHAGECF